MEQFVYILSNNVGVVAVFGSATNALRALAVYGPLGTARMDAAEQMLRQGRSVMLADSTINHQPMLQRWQVE